MAAIAEVDSLLHSWYEYFNKGDFDSLSALYAPDSIVLPHGHPQVNGPEGAKAVFSTFRAAGSPHFPHDEAEFHQLSDNVIISTGKMVIEWKETNQRRNLKDVVVWQKQADGNWKIFRDIFNWDLS